MTTANQLCILVMRGDFLNFFVHSIYYHEKVWKLVGILGLKWSFTRMSIFNIEKTFFNNELFSNSQNEALKSITFFLTFKQNIHLLNLYTFITILQNNLFRILTFSKHKTSLFISLWLRQTYQF